MVFLLKRKNSFIVIATNEIKNYDLSNDTENILWDKDIAESENSSHATIIASNLARSERYLSVSDDDKQLLLWDFITGCKLNTRILCRRAFSLNFTFCEKYVIVGDKSGDIYTYSIHEDEPGVLIAGHVSLLLDVKVTFDNFLVSADKDDKIRISLFPNSYNIHGFCLGHEGFITRIVLIDSNLIISGSADGTLRLWNYKECLLINVSDCKEFFSEMNANEYDNQQSLDMQLIVKNISCSMKDTFVVSFVEKPTILIYELDRDKLELRVIDQISLRVAPWDLSIDEFNNIWVLLPSKENLLCVFSHDTNGKYGELKGDELNKVCDSNHLSVYHKIKNDLPFFNSSLSNEDMLLSIARTYENPSSKVGEYYKHKEERIEKQKKRRKTQKRNQKKTMKTEL